MPPAEDWRIRFWRYVDKGDTPDSCWEWTGARVSKGYGNLCVDYKMVSAHRLSWVLHFGAIPAGLHVLHDCDNPPCVRPDHLHLGTNQQNQMESFERTNRSNAGERNSRAKLTWELVREIRAILASGTETQACLADRLGIPRVTVNHISTGRTWRENSRGTEAMTASKLQKGKP